MRNFLTASIFFLAWFGLVLFYLNLDVQASYNSIFSTKEKAVVFSEVEAEDEKLIETTNHLLSVFDENKNKLFSLDTIYIEKNNDNVMIKLPVQEYFEKLTDFISKNNKSIEIISHYSAEENFSSPNLGVKRGKSLEKLIIESGVRINEIQVKGVLKEIDFDIDNKAYGNLYLIVKETQQTLKSTLDELNTNVYPTFTFARILVNDELREYAEKLKEYLEQNPNRNVLIIGHTDNIGSHADTHELGLKYARQVRAYLINNQRIEAGRLVAMSLGKESPIADNSTEEGRKKNLRIEFKVE